MHYFFLDIHKKVVIIDGDWCICNSFYLHPHLQRCKYAICIPFLQLLFPNYSSCLYIYCCSSNKLVHTSGISVVILTGIDLSGIINVI